MHSLQNITWLIPGLPLVGSLFIAILLISFNRTMNRLTKPVSLFLITCLSFSTLISIILLIQNGSETSFELDFLVFNFRIHSYFYLNLFIEKVLSVSGLTVLISMILSYYLLDRKQGYVRYLSFLSALSGVLFFIVLNGLIPTSLT